MAVFNQPDSYPMLTQDIETLTDTDRMVPLQWKILTICLFALMVDGFDVYVMGILTPSIAADLNVQPSSLTWAFFAQQAGLAVGAFAIGPLADRYGRRNCLALSTLGVGAFTIAAGFSESVFELAALRCVGGLFMSGLLPSAITLATEYAPKRRQAGVASTMLVGYTLGMTLTAGAASLLVSGSDWRMLFWLGGGLGLAASLLVTIFAPESLQFMVRKNPRNPAIGQIVSQFQRTSPCSLKDIQWTFGSCAESHVASAGDLLMTGYRRPTVMLWSAQFSTIGLSALFASWASTFFLNGQGVSVANYARVQALVALTAIAGTLFIGPLIQRFGPGRVMVPIFLGYAASIIAAGLFPFGNWASMIALAFQYGFAAAGSAGLIVIAVQLYPPAMRAMGIGWCFGIGRVGAIVGPVLGGSLVASDLSLPQIFAFIAILPFLTAIILLALSRSLSIASRQSRNIVGAA
ncbi:MFS transporter [Sphingobium sp. 15-1]|nr:MFS transporter [Sphingobium sp. 15-1]